MNALLISSIPLQYALEQMTLHQPEGLRVIEQFEECHVQELVDCIVDIRGDIHLSPNLSLNVVDGQWVSWVLASWVQSLADCVSFVTLKGIEMASMYAAFATSALKCSPCAATEFRARNAAASCFEGQRLVLKSSFAGEQVFSFSKRQEITSVGVRNRAPTASLNDYAPLTAAVYGASLLGGGLYACELSHDFNHIHRSSTLLFSTLPLRLCRIRRLTCSFSHALGSFMQRVQDKGVYNLKRFQTRLKLANAYKTYIGFLKYLSRRACISVILANLNNQLSTRVFLGISQYSIVSVCW